MPTVPYLFFSFSGSSDSSYRCVLDTPDGLDIGPDLVDWFNADREDSELHAQIVKRYAESLQPMGEQRGLSQLATLFSAKFSCSKKLIVSVETLERLDPPIQSMNANKIYRLVLILARLIHKEGHSIGINFREVFLEGPTMPTLYRAGADRTISSIAEYRAVTSSFSYRFSRALVKFFFYSSRSHNHFAYPEMYHWNYPFLGYSYEKSLQTPLSHSHYLRSEADALFVLRRSSHPNSHTHLVLPFGSNVAIQSLEPVFSYLVMFPLLSELILVFKDCDYASVIRRQELCDQILDLVMRSGCCFHVQMVLITQEDSQENLLELAPSDGQTGAVRLLANNAGYYLSDPKIASAVYRNIQNKAPSLQHFTPTVNTIRGQASAYIIRSSAPTQYYRRSKRFDSDTLKQQQLTYSVTQHYTLNQALEQEQAVNQNQALNQQQHHQQQHSQQRQQNQNASTWSVSHISMRQFCDAMRDRALKILAARQMEIESHYTTAFHRQHDFIQQVARDGVFRYNIAKIIFGREHEYYDAFLYPGLAHGGFDTIDSAMVERLLSSLPSIADGLDPNDITTGVCREDYLIDLFPTTQLLKAVGLYGRRRVLMNCSVHSDPNLTTERVPKFMPNFSGLGAMAPGYRCVLQHTVLLHPDDLELLPAVEQAELIVDANALLTLSSFADKPESAAMLVFQQQLERILRFHCPEQHEPILSKWLSLFVDPHSDHLIIMLNIIITGYRPHLEQFLTLLEHLDERALLTHFYQINIEYAQTVCSITNLLQDRDALFFEIVQSMPPAHSSQDWSDFEKFSLHFMLFAAKHCISIKQTRRKDLEQFWHRIYAKFLMYTEGSEVAATGLMTALVDNLISADGFDLEPLNLASTFFFGLEEILDNAILHHTLEEQIVHLRGLSLVWTDDPYAARHNHYKVVSRLMQNRIATLNRGTNNGDESRTGSKLRRDYPVSLMTLQSILTYQQMRHKQDFYIVKIFRYLGGEQLRESLNFYDGLLRFNAPQDNEIYGFFKGQLLGYVVTTRTGEHYTRALDPVAFRFEFIKFLEQKEYGPFYVGGVVGGLICENSADNTAFKEKIHGEYKTIIETCCTDFFAYLETVNYSETKGQWCLWDFYDQIIATPKQDWRFTPAWMGFPKAKTNYTDIPPIFKKRFEHHKLAKFILVNKEDLLSARSEFDSHPEIIGRLLQAKIVAALNAHVLSDVPRLDRGIQGYGTLVGSLGPAVKPRDVGIEYDLIFKTLEDSYPNWSLTQCIQDIVLIETWIEEVASLAAQDDFMQLADSLRVLLSNNLPLSSALALVEWIGQQRNARVYRAPLMANFLKALCGQLSLLAQLPQAKSILDVISAQYSNHPVEQQLVSLLALGETLILNLDEEAAIKTLQLIIRQLSQADSDAVLAIAQQLNGNQLLGFAILLESGKISLAEIGLLLRDDPETDLTEANRLLKKLNHEHATMLMTVANTVYVSSHNRQDETEPCASLASGKVPLPYGHGSDFLGDFDKIPDMLQPHKSLVEIMAELHDVPCQDLVQLVIFTKRFQIAPERIIAMLQAEDRITAIAQVARELYSQNLERFAYDPKRIAEKIAKIRMKSYTDAEDAPLSLELQAQLLEDYQTMMSYMQDNPVWLVGERAYTVHELDDPVQCQLLFQQLTKTLRDPALAADQKHAYRLMLLALAAELLYKTDEKFPQDIQLICILHALRTDQNIIQEVKTGGGKSLILELHGILLSAEGWTVDNATENTGLANAALEQFKLFRWFLGCAYAAEIIEPNSRQRVEQGINHSSYAQFDFHTMQQLLRKKKFPRKLALLSDEIDAKLTLSIPNNLAATLNPIFADIPAWVAMLEEALAFVNNEELFLQNTCDAKEDIDNFINYFISKRPNKKLLQFIQSIPHDYVDMILESARMPDILHKNKDWRPVLKRHNQETSQYAAPILTEGTKRPEPNVAYDRFVQQLMHVYNNKRLGRHDVAYEMKAYTETLLTFSSKNFFDSYRLQKGRIIGVTATPGSKCELAEFAEQLGLVAFNYPNFYPDNRKHLGLKLVDDQAAQHAAILRGLRQQRALFPDQPILIFTDSPEKTLQLMDYLQQHASDLLLQTYDGYAADGLSESEIIRRAGLPGSVSIFNLSVGRGANFSTKYPHGFFGIGAAADITESEKTQVEGRVARFDQEGYFAWIINREDLAPHTADLLDPEARFLAHQAGVSLVRQQARLKMRLLENVRYHIVIDYFFKLREYADQKLSTQYGHQTTLVTDIVFLTALSKFNKDLDAIYRQLLGENLGLDKAAEAEFIRSAVEAYQTVLHTWVKDSILEAFAAIEPLIPLGNLNALQPKLSNVRLQELSGLSQILATGWRHQGHGLSHRFASV